MYIFIIQRKNKANLISVDGNTICNSKRKQLLNDI